MPLSQAVPVGAHCSAAFGSQDLARIVEASTGSGVALVACQAAAGLLSPVFASIIALGTALLVLTAFLIEGGRWSRPAAGRAAAWYRRRKKRWGKMTPAPTPALYASMSARTQAVTSSTPAAPKMSLPIWPFPVGVGIVLAGVLCGFGVPVGAHCSGAFTKPGTAVSGDFFQAYKGRNTDYPSVCHAAGVQQAVIWWAVIAAGVGVFCAGFALRNRARRLANVMPSAAQVLTAAAAPAPVATAPVSIATELAHLAQLRDQGVLTQEEFEQQNARLLSM